MDRQLVQDYGPIRNRHGPLFLTIAVGQPQQLAVRCDFSLCQLGFVFLDHFLNEDLLIPVTFQVPFGGGLKVYRSEIQNMFRRA